MDHLATIAALERKLAAADAASDEKAAAEVTLRESEARSAFLLRLSDSIRPLEDFRQIQHTALRLLGEALGADRVGYAEDAGAGEIVVTHNYTAGVASLEGRYRYEDFGARLLARLRAGEVVVREDIACDPGLNESEKRAHAALGLGATVNLPLVRGGRLRAVFFLHHQAAHAFTQREIGFLTETADRVWTAIARARAEAALRDSEKRFRDFVTASADAVYRMGPDWTEMRRLDGRAFLPDTEQPTRGWLDRYVHPEDHATVLAAISRAIRDRAMFELEHRVIRADGSPGWTASRAVPILAADGTIAEWLGTARDITARQEAAAARDRSETALRDSEERLLQFGEASRDVLWIRDAETLQWEYLTSAFETIYGLDRAAALQGDTMANWLGMILPADREGAEASVRRVRAGEHVTFEYRIRRPADGAVRWLRDTDFSIRDGAGQVVRVGGVGQDVTAVKEMEAALAAAEQRQRLLVEGIPQLVWRAVDNGHWTWASPQWTAYTGQADADSRGWGWLEPLHPDDREGAVAAWAQAAATGSFAVESRVRDAARGGYRWFQTRAAPVRDAAGGIAEWLGTSTDIHELRTLQEHQRVLVAELQHRTRNLIAVVRSTADKTARASTDLAGFRAAFRDRLDALARVQGLLSRLAEHDRVTFDALIGAEMAALDGAAARVTLDGPPGVRLRSSLVQTLAMALHELATNAVKYGALGQPQARLHVSWALQKARPGGEPWLRIEWRESDVRMPPEQARPPGGGQGRMLIERALPYQLGARTTYVLGADGAHCIIEIPVSETQAEWNDEHG